MKIPNFVALNTECLSCFGSFLGAFAKLRKATVSFVMSVRLSIYLSARNNSAPNGPILIKLDI